MKGEIKSLLPSDFIPTPSQKQKKHATWIIHRYPPITNAGGELMAHNLNVFLVKNGWTVTILLPSFPKKSYEGIDIVEFSDKKEVETILSQTSVILSHMKLSPLAVTTAKQLNLPIVLVMHGTYQVPWLRDYIEEIPKKQLHLIHNSEWVKHFYRSFKLDGKVLYPPVDYSEYTYPTSRHYVTLVNCDPDKGGEILVKIAKAMPSVEFLGVLGGYGHQFVEKGIPNLRYMKNTPDPSKFYSQTDIILMPSYYESWGRVAVEAMSLGIPVIAHPTPGLKESLGDAGLFANRDSIDQWVRLIDKLKTDPWFYGLKSAEGRVRARHLDPAPQLKEIESWLKSL